MLTTLCILQSVIILALVLAWDYSAKLDKKTHQNEISDAAVRIKNANSVANKLSGINQSWHQMMMRNGNVRCNRCGKFVRYADAYIDTGSDCCLCQSCADKSLSKKDVCHV